MENQNYLKDVIAYQKAGKAKRQSMLARGLVRLSEVQKVTARRVAGSNFDLSKITHIDFFA